MIRIILIFTCTYLLTINKLYCQNNNYGIPDYNSENITKARHFRINFDLGYGNWNKTIRNGTQDFIAGYYHGLKEGFDIEASAMYLFKEYFGIGFTGMRFDAYNKLNNVYLIDDSTNSVIAIGSLEDDIRILFIGTTLCIGTKTTSDKNILYFELSPGIIFYKNTSNWVIYSENIRANTFGIDLAANYEFRVTDMIGVSLGANVLLGSLDKAKVNGVIQNYTEKESMSRINFTLGFNIYL